MRQGMKAGAVRKPQMAVEYMSELIDYGGTMIPRADAYQLLVKVAIAQGHDNPRVLADRWMQGYDLRHKK